MNCFRPSRLLAACILALMTAAPAHASHWFTWIDELSGPGRFHGYQFTGELLCIGSRPDLDSMAALINDFKKMKATIEHLQNLAAAADNNAAISVQAKLLSNYFDQQARLQTALENAETSAKKFPLCRIDRQNTIAAIVLEYGRFDDKNSRHEDKYTGVTQLSNAQLIAYFPLHRVFGPGVQPSRMTRALELGAGAGTYHLTGETVRNSEVWIPAVPLRIRFIPAELFNPDPTGTSDTGSTRRRLWQSFQLKVGWDYIPTKARWNELLQSTGGGSGFTNNESQELVWTWGFQLDLGQIAWAIFDKRGMGTQ